ncbi:MAG TPA: endonuclease/exonuclease/phosphatase family protein [Steroidobacteraceae bacterium]
MHTWRAIQLGKRMRMAVLLFASVLVLPEIASAADSETLRFMTYNIRLDIASDGENSWSHRRDWVAAQVQWLHPDIFGMQEVLPNQKADLVAKLPQYRLLGGGREDGKEKGEACPLAFDTQRFELLDHGQFWLSPTPAVPSKGWDAAFNRVVTWARLKIKESEDVVLAINTHWDHIGLIARKQSAMQMSKWIAANAKPCERVLVFGDFNSEYGSDPLDHLRTSRGLRDARHVSKSAPFGPSATFNGFKSPPEGAGAIDHFLLGGGIEVERYLVLSQTVDGRWPSDHFPVLVDVTLARCR